jgi:hypothetical protein
LVGLEEEYEHELKSLELKKIMIDQEFHRYNEQLIEKRKIEISMTKLSAKVVSDNVDFAAELKNRDKELIQRNDKLRNEVHDKIGKMHFDYSKESASAVENVSKNQTATNMRLRRHLTKTGEKYKILLRKNDSISNRTRQYNVQNSIYLDSAFVGNAFNRHHPNQPDILIEGTIHMLQRSNQVKEKEIHHLGPT